MIDPRLIPTIIFMPLICLIFIQDSKKYEHRYDHIYDETGHYIKHVNATYFFHITIDDTSKSTSSTISQQVNYKINHDRHINYMFFEIYRYDYCGNENIYNLTSLFRTMRTMNLSYAECMTDYNTNRQFYEALLYKK